MRDEMQASMTMAANHSNCCFQADKNQEYALAVAGNQTQHGTPTLRNMARSQSTFLVSNNATKKVSPRHIFIRPRSISLYIISCFWNKL